MQDLQARVTACSPYVAETIDRFPELLEELSSQRRLDRASVPGELSTLVAAAAPPDLASAEFQRQLRLLRHRELLRIVWRDVSGAAQVEETLRDLSDLADAAINAALAQANAALSQRQIGRAHV